ncbi:PTS mannose/fructose/sorbose transporter subunit IIB [Clostridium sp. MCC353]|uniref:PTS system mannose/fructose/N-acetylgalactosamine-transporter subunit IIB n=1 Tax=Clostridium sp. MCC353 TaxID=2592646 RepID=UPI001C01DEA3|nr:PTS sugar transporter subunit IIB [Clostridium sp. MCC353]MBT9776589.1 PTS mannose/fructose/sorbose transporter subunit IIB [Clostridium sp. MCC353]
MIKMLRIDDRMVHGQIAVLWTKQLDVTHILVANDKVAQNDIQKASLKMAAPASVKCSILSVEDAVSVATDQRAENFKILMLVNNTADARTIAERIKGIEVFNVGNYGLIGENVSAKRKLGDTFYVDEKDVENLKAVIGTGVKSVYQLVPTKPAEPLQDLLK